MTAGARSARGFRALFAGLVAAQVAYSRVPEERRVAATRAIVGLMTTTAVADATRVRGRGRGLALLGSAGGLGFAAELVGVATGRPFGTYHYTDRLGPRVGGVPVAAAAAWAMMARPAWVVAGLITRRRPMRVPLAAGALTAWDVFLDPRMAREGFWVWPQGGRYEGIPASNFLGWLGTGLAVFGVWALVDGGDDPREGGDGALALYAWTWAGETFANVAVWRRPRVAAAGALAMGAFAAPALRNRLRRRR